MLPLARALRARGHDVSFATSAEHEQQIQDAGFGWFAAGVNNAELSARFVAHYADLPPLTSPEYFPYIVARRYGLGDAPDRLADLQGLSAQWRPQAVVFESTDFAAPVFAALLDVPAIHHSFGRALPEACYERSVPYVGPLWQQAGVDMPALAGMYAQGYVDICPASLQGDLPVGATVLPLRPASATEPGEQQPLWPKGLPNRPGVYVTLGTVFNSIKSLRLLLDAVSTVECNVIMTVGRDKDPEDLGPLPPHVVVERFIPQESVLPYVDAAVVHAGSGSMLAALAQGVPMLMLPRAADQYENARACAATGAAHVLLPDQCDVASIAAGIQAVLFEPAFRAGAAAMREEIASMPGPDAVAAVVEETLSTSHEQRRPGADGDRSAGH